MVISVFEILLSIFAMAANNSILAFVGLSGLISSLLLAFGVLKKIRGFLFPYIVYILVLSTLIIQTTFKVFILNKKVVTVEGVIGPVIVIVTCIIIHIYFVCVVNSYSKKLQKENLPNEPKPYDVTL